MKTLLAENTDHCGQSKEALTLFYCVQIAYIQKLLPLGRSWTVSFFPSLFMESETKSE